MRITRSDATIALVMLLSFQPVPAFAFPLKELSKHRSAYTCPDAQHQKASAALKGAFDNDQEDRKNLKSVGLAKVSKRDVKRRELVSAVFAQGCIISGKDCYYASRIFQHGNVPDHYFQAYLWASAAVARGYLEAQKHIPKSIDRYLINNGYMQLLGTNAQCAPPKNAQPDRSGGNFVCCLSSVVPEISDEMRAAFEAPSLEDRILWVQGLNQNVSPNADPFCTGTLVKPPRGVFPGIW